MIKSLQGLRVLNTRPIKQGLELSQKIREAGGISIDCPALAICATQKNWLSTLPALPEITLAVFISRNAVEYFFSEMEKAKIKWPPGIETIAIGKATASALEKCAIPVHHTPEVADSEHLLNLAIMKDIHQKKILLVKGTGGRPLLEKAFVAAGAELYVTEVYTRDMPFYQQAEVNSIWQNNAVDIILYTSEQAMLNLLGMFGPQARDWLSNKPSLVISERLAKTAAGLGMQHIIISAPDKLFETLCDYNQGIIHCQ